MSDVQGIQIEMKKNSLKQLQSGDWVVSFTASQIDFPTDLATAAMGQRFMAVLVPLGDFEEAPSQTNSAQKNKYELSRQAAMRCDDPRFWTFLTEYGPDPVEDSVAAAEVIRMLCDVQSRSEFDTNPKAAEKWRNLKASFDAWLQV